MGRVAAGWPAVVAGRAEAPPVAEVSDTPAEQLIEHCQYLDATQFASGYAHARYAGPGPLGGTCWDDLGAS